MTQPDGRLQAQRPVDDQRLMTDSLRSSSSFQRKRPLKSPLASEIEVARATLSMSANRTRLRRDT
jgi:hypothetical protein